MLHTCCYWGIPYITAEKISHMPFYYIKDVYHRKQLGTETAEKEVYRALTENVCFLNTGKRFFVEVSF